MKPLSWAHVAAAPLVVILGAAYFVGILCRKLGSGIILVVDLAAERLPSL